MFRTCLDQRTDVQLKQCQKTIPIPLDAVLIVPAVCYGHPLIPQLSTTESREHFLRFSFCFFFCGRRALVRKGSGLQVVDPANQINDQNEENNAQQERYGNDYIL